jgi:predicted CXXCH cytochrome family protein
MLALLCACAKRPDANPKPAVPQRDAAASAQPIVQAPPPAQAATYAGSAACLPCHEAEAKLWRGSHHDLAMQEPTSESVLGDFARRTFKVGSESFTFRKQDETYWVDVAQGRKKSSFPVRYVFGVEPLQQLLLDVGKGHLQALSVAWDARKKEQGGQRWFFLQQGEQIPPGDPLHWQGPQFNWNNMCADCHSTNVEKGYARETHSYDTRFAEIDVACEACHGPSSLHVSAAQAKGPARSVAGFRGLTERDRRWVFSAGAAIAHLEGERSDAELESCAPCHSRRAELGPAGASYHDRFRLSLLEAPLYFPDGQVQDEVFELGSFLQSRMHAAGVTCSDCHDPHSSAPRVSGNALCTKCHKGEVYDREAHHFHAAESAGAACVACHMPERTYMVIDARREHRFSVPRPDLSARLHSPDPCTSCHRDESPEWAARELAQRKRLRPGPHFGSALLLAREQAVGARSALSLVCADASLPAIVRATALSELAQQRPGPELFSAVDKALHDASPLLRRAAVEALTRLPVAMRDAAASALFTDRFRSVRIEAAESLISADTSGLSPATRALFLRALGEYIRSAEYRADRGDGLAGLANVRLAAGDLEGALALLTEAISIEPSFTVAYVNKADVLRGMRREAEAEAVLQAGLSRVGDRAALLHALGLSQVRSHNIKQALENLGAAQRARPEMTRYAFVYAIALFDTGEKERALEVLRDASARAPADEQTLSVLADYSAQLGLNAEAQKYSARLAELRAGSAPPAN